MKIHAAVTHAPFQPYVIETLELAAPGPGEVLVKIAGVGICHTDISVSRKLMPVPFPIVLGHEAAGRVVEAGAGAMGLSPGDPVVLTFRSCGQCSPCISHHPAYCESYGQLNFTGRRPDGTTPLRRADGTDVNAAFHGQSSFATHALVHQRSAIKVRGDAPLELLGAFGCGFQTGAGTVINVLRPHPDSTLVILGAGALGFAALFAAKHARCRRIVVVDRVAGRLRLAAELGATDVVDTTGLAPADAFANLPAFDYVVETTGVPKLAQAAIAKLASCGTCALLGGGADRMMEIDMLGLIRGKVIRGVIEGDTDLMTLIPQLVDEFVAGRFPVDRISRTYPFEAINEAVADAESGVTIKPVLVFPPLPLDGGA